MARNTVCEWMVVAVSLVLVALVARSEADLGCLTEVSPPEATCTVAADCTSVGGTDCTGGFCFCPSIGFCPCAAAQPVAVTPAPTVSHRGLIGLAGLLGAVGLFRLWRRGGARAPRHAAGSGTDLA